MNTDFYLKSTKFINSDNVKISEISKSFDRTGRGIVIEILSWLHKNIKSKKNEPELKNEFFRKRTALEIIESGFATGCTEITL